MTDDRWLRVKHLFEATVKQQPSDRSAFLSAAVAGDETLRREVEALLAANRPGSAFTVQWPTASESLLAELRNAFGRMRSVSPSSPGLTAGSRLGNYEIVAPLGVGGMGEVYRAHDARLRRDVAIKILPSAFTTHPERLARFEREARVLAALVIRTLRESTVLKRPEPLPRSCWNSSKGRRLRISSKEAALRLRKLSRSDGRSPTS